GEPGGVGAGGDEPVRVRERATEAAGVLLEPQVGGDRAPESGLGEEPAELGERQELLERRRRADGGEEGAPTGPRRGEPMRVLRARGAGVGDRRRDARGGGPHLGGGRRRLVVLARRRRNEPGSVAVGGREPAEERRRDADRAARPRVDEA